MPSSKIFSTENVKDYQKFSEIAKKIRERHARIALDTDENDKDKNILKDLCKDIFFEDFDKAEVVNNHEINEEDSKIRVNYRMSGPPMKEINKKPAQEVLKELFPDPKVYKKLFTENKSITINADQDKLISQSADHPECFKIRLKEDLTADQLMELVTKFPNYFDINVANSERYADVYPQHSTTKISVVPANNFVDSCNKLDKVILTKNLKVLKKITEQYLNPVVICGNASVK